MTHATPLLMTVDPVSRTHGHRRCAPSLAPGIPVIKNRPRPSPITRSVPPALQCRHEQTTDHEVYVTQAVERLRAVRRAVVLAEGVNIEMTKEAF